MGFAGLHRPEEFREVTRAHVIAWRDQLVQQGLANDTIRRKLAALSSLYAYLCDRNAVLHNPVLGVKRPRSYIVLQPAFFKARSCKSGFCSLVETRQ